MRNDRFYRWREPMRLQVKRFLVSRAGRTRATAEWVRGRERWPSALVNPDIFSRTSRTPLKLVPEGVEGQVPLQGPGFGSAASTHRWPPGRQWATWVHGHLKSCGPRAEFVGLWGWLAGKPRSRCHDYARKPRLFDSRLAVSLQPEGLSAGPNRVTSQP